MAVDLTVCECGSGLRALREKRDAA